MKGYLVAKTVVGKTSEADHVKTGDGPSRGVKKAENAKCDGPTKIQCLIFRSSFNPRGLYQGPSQATRISTEFIEWLPTLTSH